MLLSAELMEMASLVEVPPADNFLKGGGEAEVKHEG